MDVRRLAVAADVVDLAGPPLRQATGDRLAVVGDMQPIAHLESVAVHREGLAPQNIDERERDELLGELIGPVVVRAVAQGSLQSVSLVIRAYQMIRGGLAGG